MIPKERRTIDHAIARLRDAWNNAGPVPDYHQRVKPNSTAPGPLSPTPSPAYSPPTLKETSMTNQTFREEWRANDPDAPWLFTRHYDTREGAYAETKMRPWLVVQRRLVSEWEDDQ